MGEYICNDMACRFDSYIGRLTVVTHWNYRMWNASPQVHEYKTMRTAEITQKDKEILQLGKEVLKVVTTKKDWGNFKRYMQAYYQ